MSLVAAFGRILFSRICAIHSGGEQGRTFMGFNYELPSYDPESISVVVRSPNDKKGVM